MERPPTRVLLIVDVQHDFCPGGALPVPEGDHVIPVINALQPHFDVILATKDWHPSDHMSFAATHGKQPGEMITLDKGQDQVLWPVHCVQGSDGAKFAAGLDVRRVSYVALKGAQRDRDSYSGFFDNTGKEATDLTKLLGHMSADQGPLTLTVVGLATDYCVKSNALDAQRLGFPTTVLVDACRGVDLHPGDVERAVTEMRDAGVAIGTSDQVLQAAQS